MSVGYTHEQLLRELLLVNFNVSKILVHPQVGQTTKEQMDALYNQLRDEHIALKEKENSANTSPSAGRGRRNITGLGEEGQDGN